MFGCGCFVIDCMFCFAVKLLLFIEFCVGNEAWFWGDCIRVDFSIVCNILCFFKFFLLLLYLMVDLWQ